VWSAFAATCFGSNSDVIETSISDDELFPSPADDLLYKTLRESRPELVGLY
jgi:hypothetical protein